MKFRAKLLLGGKSATGIHVPDPIVTALGSSKRPAVRVTIRGHTYRTSIASMRGKFMLPVSAEVRANAGIEAGDQLDVELELDTAPREVTVPADFAKALAREAKARGFFDTLSYTHRRWYVSWIEQAKQAETRERRVAKAVGMLRAGLKQG